MESLLSLLRMHWDHEPQRSQRRAGVPPAQRARQRERFRSVGVADGGRRDACPTLRFVETVGQALATPRRWRATLTRRQSTTCPWELSFGRTPPVRSARFDFLVILILNLPSLSLSLAQESHAVQRSPGEFRSGGPTSVQVWCPQDWKNAGSSYPSRRLDRFSTS